MVRARTYVAGGIAGVVALWFTLRYYVSQTVERVASITLLQGRDVEFRQYPGVVVVETTAASETAAFRRLQAYASGANDLGVDVETTVPIRTRRATVETTVSRHSTRSTDGVTMGFFLPHEYTPETAPRPIDPGVSLTVEGPQTLAVRQIPRFSTAGRIERQTCRLIERLTRADVRPVGDPVILRYDDGRRLPFPRQCEVAIEVE